MLADVLRQNPTPDEVVDGVDQGTWTHKQDRVTGEIIRKWDSVVSDDPETPEVEVATIPCIVRGIVSRGLRGQGTSQSFSSLYQDIDYVQMTFSAQYVLTNRDRVTNIRDQKGNIIWRDEEIESGGTVKPTVFNVRGVTPVPDPFGQHIENFAILEKAEV